MMDVQRATTVGYPASYIETWSELCVRRNDIDVHLAPGRQSLRGHRNLHAANLL